jgi:hypothetical protein
VKSVRTWIGSIGHYIICYTRVLNAQMTSHIEDAIYFVLTVSRKQWAHLMAAAANLQQGALVT